jgi:hypothetical protein
VRKIVSRSPIETLSLIHPPSDEDEDEDRYPTTGVSRGDGEGETGDEDYGRYGYGQEAFNGPAPSYDPLIEHLIMKHAGTVKMLIMRDHLVKRRLWSEMLTKMETMERVEVAVGAGSMVELFILYHDRFTVLTVNIEMVPDTFCIPIAVANTHPSTD